MRKGLQPWGSGQLPPPELLWVILNAGPGTPPADRPLPSEIMRLSCLRRSACEPGGTGTVTVAAVREWTQARYLQGLGRSVVTVAKGMPGWCG